MTRAALLIVALTLTGDAFAANPRAVVVEVGTASVTVADVLQRRRADTPEATRGALQQLVREHLLAVEARTILGPRARGLEPAEAARRILAQLFDPGQRCRRLPTPMMRQHYAETRWRFVAPPAWVVDDIQQLCCRRPADCAGDEARRCLEQQRHEAHELVALVPRTSDAPAFRAAYQLLAERHHGLTFKRYTFFHDPGAPDAKHDPRLQTVDRPISRAVASLQPGRRSDLIESRFGFHVLRLDRVRQAIRLEFDDPRTQALLRTELCPFFLVAQRRQYVADLARTVPLRVFHEVLREELGISWGG